MSKKHKKLKEHIKKWLNDTQTTAFLLNKCLCSKRDETHLKNVEIFEGALVQPIKIEHFQNLRRAEKFSIFFDEQNHNRKYFYESTKLRLESHA
jgi:hypothetical protein